MWKPDISGVVYFMWFHFHGSRPLWCCSNIHLRPTPSMLQHQGTMVGLIWLSIICIYPLIMCPSYATLWYILGGLWCDTALSWLNATVMVLKHPLGIYIVKWVATPESNDWAHMTLNTMHQHTSGIYTKCFETQVDHGWAKMIFNTMHIFHGYGSWLCKKMIYLWWFMVCCAIPMDQG